MLNSMIADEGSRAGQRELIEILWEIAQIYPIDRYEVTSKWSFRPFTPACISPIDDDRRIIPFANASVRHPIEDIINEDGILSLVLSSLRIREAARTSALSSRWRSLWTHFRNLTFDAFEMFDDFTVQLIYSDTISVIEKLELLKENTEPFIRSVNSVLQQLQGRHSPVGEFVVRYFLQRVHYHHIDSWVRFAISMKTKVLALHLQKQYYDFVDDFDGEKYEFPCHLLEPSAVEELILSSCSLKYPSSFGGLSHLKELRLYLVDVAEEDITRIVSNCYTLECLKLHLIPNLATLRISRPQSRLRTFIAKECGQLREEIMINAVNLKNLGYDGPPVDFMFTQSFELLDAYIRFETIEIEPSLGYYLNKLSSYLPQLEVLFCTMAGSSKVPTFQVKCNCFVNLIHLEWYWEVWDQKMSRHHLATLLDATPFLEQLKLRVGSSVPFERVPKRLRNLRKRMPERPHAFLRRLLFINFEWDKWHAELLLYLMKNAVELKTLAIPNIDIDERNLKKLRRQVPEEVELLISMDNNT